MDSIVGYFGLLVNEVEGAERYGSGVSVAPTWPVDAGGMELTNVKAITPQLGPERLVPDRRSPSREPRAIGSSTARRSIRCD